MKQSRAMSMLESTINILVGFGISFGAQLLFLPLLGVAINFTQNLTFALIMTVISIARSYLLRRVFEALHIRRPLSPFMAAVIAERFRQVEAEGWSQEHDDKHKRCELALAGAAYARDAGTAGLVPPMFWPWDAEWWKPAGFRRDLVKGAALIIAEGEKFDRNRRQDPSPLAPMVPPVSRPPHDAAVSHQAHFGGRRLPHGKLRSEHAGTSE